MDFYECSTTALEDASQVPLDTNLIFMRLLSIPLTHVYVNAVANAAGRKSMLSAESLLFSTSINQTFPWTCNIVLSRLWHSFILGRTRQWILRQNSLLSKPSGENIQNAHAPVSQSQISNSENDFSETLHLQNQVLQYLIFLVLRIDDPGRRQCDVLSYSVMKYLALPAEGDTFRARKNIIAVNFWSNF